MSSDTCTEGCGNTKVTENEECDDGNVVGNDGCNSMCRLEPGWSCETLSDAGTGATTTGSCTTSCGDGIKAGQEECDAGVNNGQNSGCDKDCGLQPSAVCYETEEHLSVCRLCGNGYREEGEACDPGETSGIAGCSIDCSSVTPGWDCVGGTPSMADECRAGPPTLIAPNVGQRTATSIQWTWAAVDGKGLDISRYEFEWTVLHPVHGTTTHQRVVINRTDTDVLELPKDTSFVYSAGVSACTSAGCSPMSAPSEPTSVRPSPEEELVQLAQVMTDGPAAGAASPSASGPEASASVVDFEPENTDGVNTEISNANDLGLSAAMTVGGDNQEPDVAVETSLGDDGSLLANRPGGSLDELLSLPPVPCSTYVGTLEEGILPCTPDPVEETPVPLQTTIPQTTPGEVVTLSFSEAITQNTGFEVEEMVIEVPIEEERVEIVQTPAPPAPQSLMTPPPAVSVADIEESSPMVEMTLGLPFSVEEFNDEAQNKFRMAIAAAAGVDGEHVFILEIKDISRRRQAAGIEVRTAVRTESKDQAQALAGSLTEESLNKELAQVGLPAATMVSSPKVTSSDSINCESYSTCSSVVTYVKVQIKENKKMAAGFVVLIVFGVLIAIGIKFHIYTRYVHPKLFPKDEVETGDDKKSARREVSAFLSDLKRLFGIQGQELQDGEESRASDADEIDMRLHEFYAGRISNRVDQALKWWRFVGLTKALEAWVLSTQVSKKQKAKLDRFNSLVKSPRPSAAQLSSDDMKLSGSAAGEENCGEEDERSGDGSTVDDVSAESNSSDEDEMQNIKADKAYSQDEGVTKGRGLSTLPMVDDEPLGASSEPVRVMSLQDRHELEILAGRGSTFGSTRSLEDRLGVLSSDSFKSSTAKVSADLLYRHMASEPTPRLANGEKLQSGEKRDDE